jgi:hypothetical protein
MTSKRNSSQRKPPKGKSTQSFEDEVLIAFLGTPEGKAWAKQLIEEAANPAISRKRQRETARHDALFSFLHYLEQLPANLVLPEGFHQRWEKWIKRFEQEEIAKLPPKSRSKASVGKWVKRGWVTTELTASGELQTGQFIYHDKKPNAAEHPIQVIQIRQKGHWRMTEDQFLATRAHPFVRTFCASLPTLSDKSAVLGKIRWSSDLQGESESPEDRLKYAAGHLHVALYADARKCLAGDQDQCAPFGQLPEEAPIWKILNAAIGFGRMLEHQEVFGDGTVETLINRSLAPSGGRKLTDSGFRIEALLGTYQESGEGKLTPKLFLKWLGGVRDESSDANVIVFPHASRGHGLTDVSWDRLKNLVKSAVRRMKKGD